DLQAPEGTGARRPGFARPRRAATAAPPRAQAAEGSDQMAGALPAAVGGQLPAPRCPARAAQSQGTKTRRSPMTTAGALKLKTPERIVNSERFDEAWYPGEALGTLVLVEQGGKTTLTYTMRYESRAARDAVIKSNMESGVAASYDRLAELLAATPARGRA